MQMSNNSRQSILSAIRDNLPEEKVEHPRIPVFRGPAVSLKALFEQHFKDAGGTAHDLRSVAEAEAKLMAVHPEAKVVCSAAAEIAGTRRVETVNDPHELADVGVVRAQFGVAESGAVWLTQEDLVVDGLGFLSQHLVVLLDPEEIVADMQEAYRCIRLDLTAYGCFMMGPSATADIEATLVHGAQGARSLTYFSCQGIDDDERRKRRTRQRFTFTVTFHSIFPRLTMAIWDRTNKKRSREHLVNCLMLVTALNPHIGYEKATKLSLAATTKTLLNVRLR
jgi:L-lactate dehydrogenase complex protein LldG